MATIDSIPLELVAQILGHLDSMASLRRAIRTSRRFHKAFVELPHTAHHILRNQIPGPLLPIAIAISKAAAAPKGTLSPEPFLDSLLEQPGDLASEIHGLSLPALATMSRTHSVIDEFATDFARGAWATLSEHVHGQSQPLTLSPDEELRIFRAFYRMELYFSLSRHVDTFDDKFGPSFCLRFAPWELEQISSVQEYLEARFAQASREPLEHDITMGEFSIDYLKSGPDNYPRQHWLAHGVSFTHTLINTASYDAKLDLLNSHFACTSGNLPEALVSAGDDAYNLYPSHIPMSSYMDALQRDFPAAAGVDRGPFEAWRIVADLYGHPVYFSARETWLRECAYVFWDLARIDPPGIRDVIRDPYTKVNSYTDQEWEDMNDSFRERSDLWARSGAATEYFKQGVCWYTRPIREY